MQALPLTNNLDFVTYESRAESLRSKGYRLTGHKRIRARQLVEALITGDFQKGNHRITVVGAVITFHYRGTPIVTYDQITKAFRKVKGDYEGSVSTKNQRRIALDAICDVTGLHPVDMLAAQIDRVLGTLTGRIESAEEGAE